MIGWAVRQLALWGALGMLVYALVGHHLPAPPEDAVPPVAAAAPAVAPTEPPRGVAPNALVYRANRQGHVVLDGVVNGATVKFLVDTGATVVALTLHDAAAAGFGGNNLSFRATVNTASGQARAAPVQLREIRLGQFSARDVPAVVIENLHISLLGQSLLNRLDGYQMRDGVLTLNWR